MSVTTYSAPPMDPQKPCPPPGRVIKEGERPFYSPDPNPYPFPSLKPGMFIEPRVSSRFVEDWIGRRVRIEKIDVYCFSTAKNRVMFGPISDPFAYDFMGTMEEFEKLIGEK